MDWWAYLLIALAILMVIISIALGSYVYMTRDKKEESFDSRALLKQQNSVYGKLPELDAPSRSSEYGKIPERPYDAVPSSEYDKVPSYQYGQIPGQENADKGYGFIPQENIYDSVDTPLN